MHSWVKGYQVCRNEGQCPISRADNEKIVKVMGDSKFKIVLYEKNGPNSSSQELEGYKLLDQYASSLMYCSFSFVL